MLFNCSIKLQHIGFCTVSVDSFGGNAPDALPGDKVTRKWDDDEGQFVGAVVCNVEKVSHLLLLVRE